MEFTAHINIMPLKELLDPQGKAVNSSLHNLGLDAISNVRVGKHLSMFVRAASLQEAEQFTIASCKKLLANQVMETFEFTITENK